MNDIVRRRKEEAFLTYIKISSSKVLLREKAEEVKKTINEGKDTALKDLVFVKVANITNIS